METWPQASCGLDPWGHPEAMRRPEQLLGRKWEAPPSLPWALSLLSMAGVFLELNCSRGAHCPPPLHPTLPSPFSSILQRSQGSKTRIGPKKMEVIFCNLVLCNQMYAF